MECLTLELLALGAAVLVALACIAASPAQAPDDKLARYKTAEKIAKVHLAKFDTLDFDVFTNQKWDRLK
jgi:hypothetical protein